MVYFGNVREVKNSREITHNLNVLKGTFCEGASVIFVILNIVIILQQCHFLRYTPSRV